MNKFHALFCITILLLSCNQQREKSQNEFLTDIEEKMMVDEEQYEVVGPDDKFKQRVSLIWELGYDSVGYNQFEKIIDTLLQYGYLRAAEAMASKVKINDIHPHKRTNFYESMGIICKYTLKPDSAIYYFRYVYLLHPKVPEYIGHNQLHFYDEAVMTYIESENCVEAKLYYDSLLKVINKYPDSIFYIGGELKLEELDYYINLICQK